MAILSWHDRYQLGHAELDAQHRMLFELVNHFQDVVEMDMPEELGRILDDLILRTEAHFRYEEALMDEVGFPDISDHRKMHRELMGQLQQLAVRQRSGGHLSMRSVIRFLVDWLTNHIMREDTALRSYLRR